MRVHATPALGQNAVAHRSLRAEFEGLRKRILAYQTKHLGKVRSPEFNPRGLSPEVTVIANALGSCIVGGTANSRGSLLRCLDRGLGSRSPTALTVTKRLVVGAALALPATKIRARSWPRKLPLRSMACSMARGETRRVSPEKVGHKLKKVGVFTRRLSQSRQWPDPRIRTTRIRLHRSRRRPIRGEDSIEEDEKRHCPLREKDELLREVI